MANQTQENFGKILHEWHVAEHHEHERSRNWYTYAIIITLLLLVFSFLTANFFFAVIVILSALVVILHDGQEARRVRFVISDQGIIIGKIFYDYDEIRHFAVVYKPQLGVKSLYFEFRNVFKMRLSVPLENQNPLPIRQTLLKFLKEDLERNEAPLSEQLTKLFKL